jgi:hypothetical protein
MLKFIQRNCISIWNYRHSQSEMAMRGGRREGAGRPQGAKNKRTREVEAAMKAVAQEFAESVPEAFAGDGVAFLQTVYKDPKLPLGIRMDAAAKAVRFERPMLASNNVRVITDVEQLTEAELQVIADAADAEEAKTRH